MRPQIRLSGSRFDPVDQGLESVPQCNVDILTDEDLSPYLKEHIHAEAVPL